MVAYYHGEIVLEHTFDTYAEQSKVHYGFNSE